MKENLSLFIIGAYTLVYVIIFFIQKSQIDKQKDVINSMKTFMDIFNVDEVKKYVEMKNERILDQANKIITDSETIKKMSEEITKNATAPIQEAYKEIMEERFMELVKVTFEVIKNLEPEKRQSFISELLPKNQHYLSEMVKDYEKNIS